MKRKRPATSAQVTIFAAALVLFIAGRASPAEFSSAYALPGVSVSYSLRYGYRTFDNASEFLSVRDNGPVMYSLLFGKRFPLNEKWRWQLSAEGGFGFTAKEKIFYDDVPFFDTTFYLPVAMHYWDRYRFTAGVIAEAHYLFYSHDKYAAYLSFGPGTHIVGDVNRFDMLDFVISWDILPRFAGAVSVNAGIGAERDISGRIGISAAYNFRFGFARYTEWDQMYPLDANYREYFYSHAAQVQLLLRPKPSEKHKD